MTSGRRYETNPYDGWTTSMFCRKYDYSYIKGQRAYCAMPKEQDGIKLGPCLFREDSPDSIDKRCMMLERQWR